MALDKEILKDPTLSLAEKWRRHSERKKRTGINVQAIQLNRFGQVLYFFTIIGGTSWTFSIIPALYVDDGWEDWVLLARTLFLFLSAQVAIQWCMLRWVDSEYQPDIHGTKPPDFLEPAPLSSAPPGPPGTTEEASPAESVSDIPSSGDRSSGMPEGTPPNRKRNTALDHPNGGDSMKADGGHSSPSSSTLSTSSGKVVVDMDYDPPDPSRPRSYDGHSFRMLVATALPTADGEVQRKSYPYWSWVPCLLCKRLRPPRCHHCTLCGTCILKRDHHCYFVGRCVGLNNQRYFLTFLLWALLLTSFASYHMFLYVTGHMMPQGDLVFLDLLFPLTLLRALLGYCSARVVPIVMVIIAVGFCNVFSFTMLLGAAHLVYRGKTTFEVDSSIKVTDTRAFWRRIRAVMGRYWCVNFIVPAHRWFPPEEDAVFWPHIKPC